MIHGDLRDVDLSDATVVVMYLLPDAVAGLAQSHLLPLLRRGQQRSACSFGVPGGGVSLAGKDQQGVVADEPGAESRSAQRAAPAGGEDDSLAGSGDGKEDRREGSGGGDGGGVGRGGRTTKPCRIVCNTWGIPGATAVREAGVGLHGGVKLRLFTQASLPGVA